MALPVAGVGTCVASLARVHQEVTELGTRTMTDCSPRGDDQACHEALGIGVEPKIVSAVQSLLRTQETMHGRFISMTARGTCSFTGAQGSFRELRAEVEWEMGVQMVAFQWKEVEDGWQLSRLAAAQAVPRLCG